MTKKQNRKPHAEQDHNQAVQDLDSILAQARAGKGDDPEFADRLAALSAAPQAPGSVQGAQARGGSLSGWLGHWLTPRSARALMGQGLAYAAVLLLGVGLGAATAPNDEPVSFELTAGVFSADPLIDDDPLWIDTDQEGEPR